ncbi:MAG: cache domain-containing protein, partial [Desulfobacteraceae bacterium]|nr:cache domain-containing protein [Desulfobacteraceae bacterium]
HPTVPALDGKVLDDPKFNCALGKKENLFKAFVDVCERDGEGFVDYLWPKPTKDGLTTDQPKLSYVRLNKEWGWIVGTGIYVDDAVPDAVAKIKQDVANMRYDGGIGYFWINDMGKPYPKMIMHPTVPALDGKVLDDPKFNCALGKKENLFKAFVDVCERGGEGFVDYLWPKPTKDGLTTDQPKLSYVKLFAPLGWVIGTGAYIDSIDAEVAAKTDALNKQITTMLVKIGVIVAVVSILGFLLLWVVADRIAAPLHACRDFARELGRGNLRVKLGVEGRDEVGQLAASLEKMQADLKALLQKIVASSRNVADGAADQAASIEETSASLEEMAAMTRQNADNAEQGNRLIGQSRAVAGEAHGAMVRLTAAMKEISAASTETQKIIRTIDEIAFQTNLLALNAAVEAARAGEAGAGFAVVADEVRNLAGRAAAAASDTEALIEKTVKKIGEGDELTAATEASFTEVIGNIAKVSELMGEIATASSEQATGIAQINLTVSSINTITQRNVDHAQELTAAIGEFDMEHEALDGDRKPLSPLPAA